MTVEGVEPKRQRGHIRVAAILQAASVLFVEQGFDAVTMTEIAARSRTAIGSLYRFFPTKEILADVLLKRFGERVDTELTAVAKEAALLSIDALADALVDHAMAWAPDRAAALVLIEARNIGGALRETIRDRILSRFGDIVAQINPALPDEAVKNKARLLQQLLKLAAANSGDSRWGPEQAAEMRALIRLYLANRIAAA